MSLKNQSMLSFIKKPEKLAETPTQDVPKNLAPDEAHKIEESKAEIENCVDCAKDSLPANTSEKTPNKRKRRKRKAEPEEETIQLSAETTNESPAQNIKSPSKSQGTQNSNSLEESKDALPDSKMEEQVESVEGRPKRKTRDNKPKKYAEEEEPTSEKKRERKLKQKAEKEEIIPEEVLAAKASINEYQNQITELIKAGIKSNSHFERSVQKNYDSNSQILSELISKSEVVDLKDPETQIIFVKTLSSVIDGSSSPLSGLVEECMNKLLSIDSIDTSKLNTLNLEEFITTNAERKVYGKAPECEDMLNDTTPEALYCWEVVNTSLIDGITSKDVGIVRMSRGLIADKIKSLNKLVKLLARATKAKDLERIQAEKEKLEKTERKETAHLQKEVQRLQQLREKEEKEAQKLEKKRQAELEKEAKEKERKLEAERKKQKEQEEKERKREEALKLKKEQEEAKKRKDEELKKKKEEEAKKKEEQLKAQQEKSNSQQKLLSFFKKNSPEKPEEEQKWEEANKTTTDLLKLVEEEKKDTSLTPESILGKFKEYLLKLKSQHHTDCLEECKKFKGKPRVKDIYIEGSHKKMSCIWTKTSTVIRGRNPFAKDEEQIDYDMDSEEEFEEENGEDIMSERDEDDDEMGEDDDEEGFIVPDGYLSQSEKNDEDEYNMRQQGNEIKKERQINTIMQPTVLTLTQSTARDMEQFRVFNAKPYLKFPLVISLGGFDAKSEEEDRKERMDPNAINSKLKEFVLMVHGSYESKSKIIEDFAVLHPECSKASIERKIREAASKEKEETQSKFRYLVNQQVITESGVDSEEVQRVCQERFKVVQDEIDRAEEEKQQEKQKEKEEKEKQKMIERERKLEEKRLEKEKKEAEKLKAKQEKEQAKILEKEEKKKLKEEKKKEKQQQKSKDNTSMKSAHSSASQSWAIKDKVALSDKDGVVQKRGRGRPKGSKNQKVPKIDSSQTQLTTLISKDLNKQGEPQLEKSPVKLSLLTQKDPDSKSITKFLSKPKSNS